MKFTQNARHSLAQRYWASLDERATYVPFELLDMFVKFGAYRVYVDDMLPYENTEEIVEYLRSHSIYILSAHHALRRQYLRLS